MPTIRIPTPLRPYSGNNATVTVSGNNVNTALDDLTQQYPDLREHLFEGEKLRSFVNIYLNQEDVRYLEGSDTAVDEDDTLMIIPSIAGGTCTLPEAHAHCRRHMHIAGGTCTLPEAHAHCRRIAIFD